MSSYYCLGLDAVRHLAGRIRLRILVAAVRDLAGCRPDRNERSGPGMMRSRIRSAGSGTEFEVSLLARLGCCLDCTIGCYCHGMIWLDGQGARDQIFGHLPIVWMQATRLSHCTYSTQAVAVAGC